MIPIYKPSLANYKKSAIKAIDSEWISNLGENIEVATDKLKKMLGANWCILMNNGTSATHALIKAAKFKYPNINKVYVPNNVFISPINCVLAEFSPDIVEIMLTDPNTLNINVSEDYFKTLEPNSLVVIVHNLGNIVNVPRLARMRPDLIFVEDNCEGLFGKYEDIYSGTSEFTLCSSVSFYANKTITTGEGGAFFTNDKSVYDYIKKLHSHGMTETRYVHDILATNWRMTNIQAGFLIDQLDDIDNILTKKAKIFNMYKEGLANLPCIRLLKEEEKTSSSNWMFTLVLNKTTYSEFDFFMKNKGVETRPIFYDLSVHPHLNLKAAQKNNFQGALLPSYPDLKESEVYHIINCVKEYISCFNGPVRINEHNSFALKTFLDQNDSPHFRHYQKREIGTCLKEHKITILWYKDFNEPVGYGHIDWHQNKNWIGLCVDKNHLREGWGYKILNWLIDWAKQEKLKNLSLTVDVGWEPAINLYQKVGFQEIFRNGEVILMEKTLDDLVTEKSSNDFFLPVSIGEAIDKLTILDIKLKKIKDQRRADVLVEREAIWKPIEKIMNQTLEYYKKILMEINESIWDDQDNFRSSNDKEEKNNLCIKIIKDNDRRFIVKKKINNLVSSSLKEQKGYEPRKIILAMHDGIGDFLISNGLVRYLSTCYEEVQVVCRKNNLSNLQLIFSDDKTIKFLPIEPSGFWHLTGLNVPDHEITKIGFHKRQNFNLDNFPFVFYDDLNLDHRIMFDYFHMPVFPESTELRNLLNMKYAVIHRNRSTGEKLALEPVKALITEDVFLIDIEENLYPPDHPYHSLAQQFVFKPIPFYYQTLIDADYLVFVDSCFFCLSIFLPIKTDKIYLFGDRVYSNLEEKLTRANKWNQIRTRREGNQIIPC